MTQFHLLVLDLRACLIDKDLTKIQQNYKILLRKLKEIFLFLDLKTSFKIN